MSNGNILLKEEKQVFSSFDSHLHPLAVVWSFPLGMQCILILRVVWLRANTSISNLYIIAKALNIQPKDLLDF